MIKKVFPLLALLVIALQVHAQKPDWSKFDSIYQARYHPQKMPQWLLPIVFKNAYTQSDTIYIGHDKEAGNASDIAMFGEGYCKLDTSRFAVFPIFDFVDSISRININNMSAYNNFIFSLSKGYAPLTMYWDDSRFYSDSLPFTSLKPKPNARGELFCSDPNPNYRNCPTDYPHFLTDKPSNFPFGVSDSLFFDGNGSFKYESFTFYVNPFDKEIGIVESSLESSMFMLSPNPLSGTEVNIKVLDENETYTWSLYSLEGRLLNKIYTPHRGNSIISAETLSSGNYIIHIKSNRKSQYFKFIKL